MFASKSDGRNIPPASGKTGFKAIKKSNSATTDKTKPYGSFKLQTQRNTPASKAQSPKGKQLDLNTNQIGKLKTSLNQASNTKRKELSPTEKTALYNKKQSRFTYVSENSSLESMAMSNDELKDLWNTMSPEAKRSKKWEYLRAMFENPKFQREQRPTTSATESKQVPGKSASNQNKVSPIKIKVQSEQNANNTNAKIQSNAKDITHENIEVVKSPKTPEENKAGTTSETGTKQTATPAEENESNKTSNQEQQTNNTNVNDTNVNDTNANDTNANDTNANDTNATPESSASGNADNPVPSNSGQNEDDRGGDKPGENEAMDAEDATEEPNKEYVVIMDIREEHKNIIKSPSELEDYLAPVCTKYNTLKDIKPNYARSLLAFFFESMLEANDFLKVTHIGEEPETIPVNCRMAKEDSWNYGIIRGIVPPRNDEERTKRVQNMMTKLARNGTPVSDIIWIKKKFLNETEARETNTVRLTFTKDIPEKVYIGFMSYKVEPYTPEVTQCYKCQGFGHVAKYCRGVEKCVSCGRIGHKKRL